MVLGYFGKTPEQPDPEVVRIASEQLKLQPTTKCPRAINDQNPNKGIEAAKKRLTEASLEITDENIFIAATCLEKGITYLKGQAKTSVRKNAPKTSENKADGYTVTVNGKNYAVKIDGSTAVVNGKNYTIDVKEGLDKQSPANTPQTPAPSAGTSEIIKTQMPGAIVKILLSSGDHVEKGDVILVMEAMKMENEIKAHCSGKISEICVSVGDQVKPGQTLACIN
jgi:pyruvate carboxylase subunit B